MTPIRRRGGEAGRHLAYVFGVLLNLMDSVARPRTWRRTVREAFARQVVSSGVGAIGFTCCIAAILGFLVVVQSQLWLRRVGQTQFLGPVLVTVIVRELGPLIADLIVIGRTGGALAVELGYMRVRNEVRVLDALGLDPLDYLLLPRVLGMTVSTMCLSLVLILTAMASGFAFANLLGLSVGSFNVFADSVIRAVEPVDVLNLVSKTLVPGLISGTLCCIQGLSASSPAEVPQACGRAVQQSVLVVFAVAAIVSLVTYL